MVEEKKKRVEPLPRGGEKRKMEQIDSGQVDFNSL